MPLPPQTVQQRLETLAAGHPDINGEALADALAPALLDQQLAWLWLAERLANVSVDPLHLPAGYADPVMQSLVMLDDGRIHLSLAIITAPGWHSRPMPGSDAPQVVGFTDGWTRLRFLAGRDASIQRFVLNRAPPTFRAIAQPPITVREGALIRLDNAYETFRFTDIRADVVMLRLLVRDCAVMEAVECDAVSGQVLRTRQAQSPDGRVQMVVSLLRSLGRRDALDIVAQDIAGWPAHLRWHGAREALASDSHAGFALLKAMAVADPDVDLRALAKRTCDDLAMRYPQLAGTG